MFNCDPKPGKCGRRDKKSYTHSLKLTGRIVLPAVIAGCGGKQKRLYLRQLISPKSLTSFCGFCAKCDGLSFVQAFHGFGTLMFPFYKTEFLVGACACVYTCVLARHCIWPWFYSIFEKMISFLFTSSFSMNKREFSSICQRFKGEIWWGIQIFYQIICCLYLLPVQDESLNNRKK